MKNIDEIIGKLNQEQVKPVLDTEGAVLVIAGAGSGKTRVLTSRIAYLVAKNGVYPDNILAITFTNKAADEMKKRLEDILGDIGGMWVSTIHSMCVKILRRDIDKIGYDKNFTIYDDTDKEKALKRVFEELKIDDKLFKNAKNHISNAKNECLSPEEYKKAYSDLKFIDEIYAVYSKYEEALSHSNSLDFDDLLCKTYELFVKRPDVADYYSDKFHYIHIDEFQDTNKVQFLIARRLAVSHGNIFVVGDDDQSIYGWRGAKIENILRFDEIYNGAKVYKLERNYRSTKKILELANHIISNNKMRRNKELWTENSDGVKVETFVGTDENNEAYYCAMQIKSLMARYPDLKYSDFAVFMRVNALTRAFEQEFTKYAIPYRIFGGFRFFERKEIKDVLAYLKIVNNPFDNESFLRSISSPKRGIGEKTLRELIEYCSSKGLSLFYGIDEIGNTSLNSSAQTKLINFKNLLTEFKEYSAVHGVSELIAHVIESTDFMEQFADKTEENESRALNIGELINAAEQYEVQNGKDSNLAEFLNSVTLSSDTDDINSDDTVSVATIHSVKGLEFKCVFVAGLDEKILPISRAFGEDEDMEEERRLMYVAITRAKERLYLTRARSRYMYGSREEMIESRFLKEARGVLSPNFVEKTYADSGVKYDRKERIDESDFGTSNIGGYSSDYAKIFLKQSKPVEKSGINSSLYKAGARVKHAKFGEGTIVSVRGDANNLVVDVAFKGIGIKSLSVKFAPMELL